jgi:uncharacterized protein (TIGR00369 family)
MSINSWDPKVVDAVREFFAHHIPFNKLVGMRVAELTEGYARLEVPFKDDLIGNATRQAIHGGAIAALIDTSGGAAGFTMVVPPDSLSTIDLRIDYLRPGEPKLLVCESKVTRMGNRICYVDSTVFHPDAPAKLLATGKAVYNVRRHKKKEDAPPDASHG